MNNKYDYDLEELWDFRIWKIREGVIYYRIEISFNPEIKKGDTISIRCGNAVLATSDVIFELCQFPAQMVTRSSKGTTLIAAEVEE